MAVITTERVELVNREQNQLFANCPEDDEDGEEEEEEDDEETSCLGHIHLHKWFDRGGASSASSVPASSSSHFIGSSQLPLFVCFLKPCTLQPIPPPFDQTELCIAFFK